MSNYPTLNELCEAIINDCYDYLERHADEKTKSSIVKLLENIKEKPEILKNHILFYVQLKIISL